MRRKIQDIICGKFDTAYEASSFPGDPGFRNSGRNKNSGGPAFEEEVFRLTVLEGESRKGSFSFAAPSGTAVRGIISCTDPCIEILNPSFDAIHVTVPVLVHAEDLLEHDTKSGNIVLLTNLGEFFYPYEIEVTKDYAHTSIGLVRNMTDFTNLARLNWQEALTLFRTARFAQIFHPGEEEEHRLYLALVSRGAGSAQMEEFLVACGRKSRNHFIVSGSSKRYQTGELPINDRIRLEKKEWGFLQFSVSAEGDFIELRGDIDEEELIRNKKIEIPYRIVPERMHGGINYGRIVIEDILERIEIEVTAVSEELHEQRIIYHPDRRLSYALQQCFLQYFMGRINQNAWEEQSLAVLEQLGRMEEHRAFADLVRGYIAIQKGKEDACRQCIEDFRRDYEGTKSSPVYGYYLYMTTFLNTDTKYVRSVAAQIRELSMRFSEDDLLTWILLKIDEPLLRNQERAYLFIRDYMSDHSGNPFFYLEAYFLLEEEPQLAAAGMPGGFEQRLLRWIAKNGLLTQQILMPVWEKMRLTGKYSDWCFEMLTAAYRSHRSNALLKEICTYLIGTESCGQEFLPWYEKGIHADLRISGLYEAYIRSFDASKNKLPSEIIKYFILSSGASWKWKASIYAYLIEHQEEAGDDWQKLRPVIWDFAQEMMERGELNPDLYVIYRFLRREIGASEWSRVSARMRSSRIVRVTDPKFKYVCVYDADSQAVLNVPIHKEQAFVNTGGASSVILLQDAHGSLYTTGSFAGVTDLFVTDSGNAAAAQPAQRAAHTQETDRQEELQKRLDAFTGSLCELDQLIADALSLEMYCLPQEEKLLTYMLFAGSLTEHHVQIFQDIQQTGENERLCDAYVSVLCRDYVCGDRQLAEPAKEYLLQAVGRGRNLNAFCRTAVLKLHYETPASHILTDANAERLLLHLLNDGLCFELFNNLPGQTKRKFLLEGLLFVQCCEDPKKKITMNAVMGLPASIAHGTEPEFCEVMKEALPGVYCFMMPVLPGSIVRFHITDEGGATLKMYEQMIAPAAPAEGAGSRYQMLTSLFAQRERDDRAAAAYASRVAWMRDGITEEPPVIQEPAEHKSDEQKPVKQEPAEPKSGEQETAGHMSDDQEPAEHKSDDQKPAEEKPAE